MKKSSKVYFDREMNKWTAAQMTLIIAHEKAQGKCERRRHFLHTDGLLDSMDMKQ